MGGLDSLWPGAGLFRYVVDLVNSLAELNPPGVKFFVLGSLEKPVVDLASVFIGTNANKFEYVHFRRSVGIGSLVRDQLALSIMLVYLAADLCHCLHTAAPILPVCPLVVTIQDLMYELFPDYSVAVKSRPYRLFRWIAQNRVARLICASRTTADDVHRLWRVNKNRLEVVYHGARVFGIDHIFPDYPENPALSRLGVSPVVTSPFNLEPRKNLLLLIEAYAWLIKRIPKVQLVLFGKGGWNSERENHYHAELMRLGLINCVIQTGTLSDSDLRWLYRRASVFAFPTLYEGFGYPILESMACGTPSVVRGCSSMAEIVGDTGLLVEPLTVEAYGTAILNLISDERRRCDFGKRAKQRSLHFTSRKMAEQTFAVYEEVLKNRRGPLARFASIGSTQA